VRLLVCGGRDWTDYDRLAWMLDRLAATNRIEVLTHGASRGADQMAHSWARLHRVPVDPWPAQWTAYPVNERWRAGHDRNRQMLDNAKPDLVVAFKVGFDWTMKTGGTENMVRIAGEDNVPTLVVGR
jgi:hypothetical protein